MKKLVTVFIVSGFVLIAIIGTYGLVFSQSHRFDGNNWVRWSEDFRIMYLTGWLDGWSTGVNQAVTVIGPEILPKGINDPRIVSLSKNVTVGQLLDAINSFFSDYRNRTIFIAYAVEIVIDEATGRRHWTEDDLQLMRRISSEKKNR